MPAATPVEGHSARPRRLSGLPDRAGRIASFLASRQNQARSLIRKLLHYDTGCPLQRTGCPARRLPRTDRARTCVRERTGYTENHTSLILARDLERAEADMTAGPAGSPESCDAGAWTHASCPTMDELPDSPLHLGAFAPQGSAARFHGNWRWSGAELPAACFEHATPSSLTTKTGAAAGN